MAKEIIQKPFHQNELITLLETQSIESVMEYFNDELNSTSERHPCPFCESGKSFAIYDESTFHCFACEAHGNPVDYIKNKTDLTQGEALKIGSEIFGLPTIGEELDGETLERVRHQIEEAKIRKEERKEIQGKIKEEKKKMASMEYLDADKVTADMSCLEYFEHRGIPLKTIPENLKWSDAYKFSNAIICPFKDSSGNVVGVHKTFLTRFFNNAKDADGRNKRLMNGECNSLIPLYKGKDEKIAIISEGLEPTVAVRNMFGVGPSYFMAASSGILAKAQLNDKFETIYVCADNDSAGIEAAKKFASNHSNVTILTAGCDWDEVKVSIPEGSSVNEVLELIPDLEVLSFAIDKRSLTSKENGSKGGRPCIDINGIALRLVEERFCDSEGILLKHYQKKWYKFNGFIYEEFDVEALRVNIIDIIESEGENVTKNLVNNIFEALKTSSLCGIPHSAKTDVFNIKTGEEYVGFLCFKDGTLMNPINYCKTEEILPPDRNIFKTKCLDFEFSPETGCPEFFEFLSDAHEDYDDIENLLKFAGLSLTKEMKFNKMLAIVGPPGTGKSVFAEVLVNVLGPYAAMFEMDDMKKDFERGRLARFNLLFANEEDGYLPEARLKDATGSGSIKDRRLYNEAVDRKKTAKLMFCSNGFKVKDRSGALLDDRIIISHWKNIVRGTPKEKKGLDRILVRDERVGIFNCYLAGLKALLEDDGFKETEKSEDYKTDIKESCNPSLRHIKSTFESCSDGFISNKQFQEQYDLYKACAKHAGEYIESLKDFKMSILKEFKAQSGKRKGQRGLIGISLKEPEVMDSAVA